MPKLSNGLIKKWLRAIHRDVGFLMVGMCLIYAVSGFLLNHMDGKDPAFKTTKNTLSFDKNLTNEELIVVWKSKDNLPDVKRVFSDGTTSFRLMLDGGVGMYNIETGAATYEHHSKRQLIYWINKLHYNKVKGWTVMADIFAISLVFLALSGLFMVSKKYGLKGRGKWYVIVGFCIPIIYLVLD